MALNILHQNENLFNRFNFYDFQKFQFKFKSRSSSWETGLMAEIAVIANTLARE